MVESVGEVKTHSRLHIHYLSFSVRLIDEEKRDGEEKKHPLLCPSW